MELDNVVKLVETSKLIPETELESGGYESTNFAVDLKTKIVYWKFAEIGTASNKQNVYGDINREYDHKVGYMCQYVGQHGRPCKLIDGKIVEISAAEMFED